MEEPISVRIGGIDTICRAWFYWKDAFLHIEYRTIVGADLASGNKIVPKETLHKYLRKNVLSATYDVPSTEWPDVGLIPCEQFVTTINGRNIPIPSKHVY